MSPRETSVRLPMLQLLAAVVDGVALSTIVLHVTTDVELVPTTVGLVLAGAAAAALLLAGPLGALADRVGLRLAGAVASCGSAVALLGYAVAGSLSVYAASAITFVVAQAVGGSIRQALAVAGLAAGARLAARATMHTLLNVGLGAGTVLGAVLAALESDAAFRLGYLGAGLANLAGAAAMLKLSRPPTATQPLAGRPVGLSVVVHDGRFVGATALASVVQLTMPILSVLLPVWVLQHTAAPGWSVGAALAVNTVLVVLTQRPWSARLGNPHAAVGSARVAAAALLAAGALLALTGLLDSTIAALAVLALAVVALTCAEVTGGAATWAVALREVPSHAEASYQSVFSMSASAARILGPAVALPLVVAHPGQGWLALTAAMAAASLGIARLAHSPVHPVPRHPERNLT